MALLSFRLFTKSSTDEALSITQRMARKRQMKRLAPKIKLGRERAKKRLASKDKLEKRSRKQARNMLLKKFTKGKSKGDLPMAKRAELEKRLDTPSMKKRIANMAKRMFKDVRKKEIERRKGGSSSK